MALGCLLLTKNVTLSEDAYKILDGYRRMVNRRNGLREVPKLESYSDVILRFHQLVQRVKDPAVLREFRAGGAASGND